MSKPVKKLMPKGGPLQSLLGDPLGLIIKGPTLKKPDESAALPEVATMPMANDAAAAAARRRRMLANQMRSGRQSTLLSATDTLG